MRGAMGATDEPLTLTRYFSPACCLVRRNTGRLPTSFNPSRGVRRRHGLVAMLLVADRSRLVDAFGGVAVGVASAFREGGTGSAAGTASQELERSVRGEGRRVMVRPRRATLAPTTDAGEGRVLSR